MTEDSNQTRRQKSPATEAQPVCDLDHMQSERSFDAGADIVTGKTVQELRYHREIVRDLSWHPHLPMMVTSAFDGSVVQWDPEQVSTAPLSQASSEQTPPQAAWLSICQHCSRCKACRAAPFMVWRQQRTMMGAAYILDM